METGRYKNSASVLSILFLLVMSSANSFVTAATPNEDKSTYTLSVVPRLPALRLQQIWQPIVSYLSSETGKDIRLQIPTSFKQFETDVRNGGPDFVFLNPYEMVIAHQRQGYVPLVKSGSKLLRGILITRADGPYKKIHDLDGLELAFPSPNAFGASLYMRTLLAEKEKLRITPRYVKNHPNVYRNVALGLSAAGGGVNSTFNKENDSLKRQLKIIYETPGVASHPLAAHHRVSESLRKAIIVACLKLAETKAGSDYLRAVSLEKPVEADFVRDYKPLSDLGLKKYFVERN